MKSHFLLYIDRPLSGKIRLSLFLTSLVSLTIIGVSLFTDLTSTAFKVAPHIAGIITLCFLIFLFIYDLRKSKNRIIEEVNPLTSLQSVLMEDCVLTVSTITKLPKNKMGMYVVLPVDRAAVMEPVAFYNIDPLDKLVRFKSSGKAFDYTIHSLKFVSTRSFIKLFDQLFEKSINETRFFSNVQEVRTVPIIDPTMIPVKDTVGLLGYLILVIYKPVYLPDIFNDEVNSCLNRYAHSISSVLRLR